VLCSVCIQIHETSRIATIISMLNSILSLGVLTNKHPMVADAKLQNALRDEHDALGLVPVFWDQEGSSDVIWGCTQAAKHIVNSLGQRWSQGVEGQPVVARLKLIGVSVATSNIS
jgi:hypothetical protein